MTLGEDVRECMEMVVSGVVVDPASQNPIVVLREKQGRYLLPIWIGVMEAGAIAAVLEEVELPRPITHDLFVSVLRILGANVLQVEITRLEEGTFYAELTLERSGLVEALDSRPSDAIALALRTGAPIYAAKSVVEEAGILVEPEAGEREDEASLEELLASLPDEVFGKYKQ